MNRMHLHAIINTTKDALQPPRMGTSHARNLARLDPIAELAKRSKYIVIVSGIIKLDAEFTLAQEGALEISYFL